MKKDVLISFDIDLLERIDKEVSKIGHGANRSAYLMVILRNNFKKG